MLVLTKMIVQEKLCGKLKDSPGVALQFAVAFEQGIKQRKRIENGEKVKEEPLLNMERKNFCRRGTKVSKGPVCGGCVKRRIKSLNQLESKDILPDVAVRQETKDYGHWKQYKQTRNTN